VPPSVSAQESRLSDAPCQEGSIRVAVDADFDAITSLINTSFPRDKTIDKGTIASWIASNNILFVATVSDKVVGCVRLDPSRQGLFHLTVVPELRHRRIGSHLVRTVERVARRARWPVMFLGVDESEPGLTEYYTKLGYSLMKELRPIVTDDADSAETVRNLIMMQKQLIPAAPSSSGSHPHAAARKRKKRQRKRKG